MCSRLRSAASESCCAVWTFVVRLDLHWTVETDFGENLVLWHFVRMDEWTEVVRLICTLINILIGNVREEQITLLFIIAFNKYLNLTSTLCDSTSNYCGFVVEVTEERRSMWCHCNKSSDVARQVTWLLEEQSSKSLPLCGPSEAGLCDRRSGEM